jgi:hypothetical protein
VLTDHTFICKQIDRSRQGLYCLQLEVSLRVWSQAQRVGHRRSGHEKITLNILLIQCLIVEVTMVLTAKQTQYVRLDVLVAMSVQITSCLLDMMSD